MSMEASSTKAPVIIIFGITGDLSKRKLLPALYHLLRQNILPPDTSIVGISRQAVSSEAFLKTVELCVLEKDGVCDPEGLQRMQAATHILQLHPQNSAEYAPLVSLLDQLDRGAKRNRLFYMAIPAAAYQPIIQHLAEAGLNDARSQLLLEKPFGYDTQSAEELIGLVNQAYSEEQVYRIDHYLAKETAQNVLAFRMHNPIFVPLWNSQHISKVHIRSSEVIDIEGRVNFYEQTGALRDIIQSHLLQLLAITLMEVPSNMSSQAIHASKEAFFAQLQPADPNQAVRAQYEGYRTEVNNPTSMTETYAGLSLRHNSERWRDTQIVLETGKAMKEKVTEIVVSFKAPHERRHNNLIFRLQPNEGISLDLVVKQPGFSNDMHHTSLDFDYHGIFGANHIEAYERVLMDAVHGDQALFASNRDVRATWRVLQPVLDAWAGTDQALLTYPKGADGPVAQT